MPYPQPYAPRPQPTLGDWPRYLVNELQDIKTTLGQVLDMLPQDANWPPTRPQEGMIRKAVDPWRPVAGQTTDRWVIYSAGAWTYLTP